MTRPLNNLALRVTTAHIVLPVVLTLIWAPVLRLGFAGLVLLIALVSLHEFLVLLRARSIPTHEPSALIGAAAIVAALPSAAASRNCLRFTFLLIEFIERSSFN